MPSPPKKASLAADGSSPSASSSEIAAVLSGLTATTEDFEFSVSQPLGNRMLNLSCGW